MSKDIYKYLIGTIDTANKKMVLVEYYSKSNLLLQAQLMTIQFPTSTVIEEYLNDFDIDEKTSIQYKSLRYKLPFISDGIFLYSGVDNQWTILDQNISTKLIQIFSESPDFPDLIEHICSCSAKKNDKLKIKYNKQEKPKKMIFTSSGFERYCNHCHSYVPISNIYYDRGKKEFESVCKYCYIPHFKPHRLPKKFQSEVEDIFAI